MIDEKTKKAIINDILKGKNPIDIVIEYGCPPSEVEKIYKSLYESPKKEVINVEIPDDILALFVLASVITALDIITTRIALIHPSAYELNPLMSYLIMMFGTEYALLMNVILSSIGLIALTILSVRSLKGYSRYIPLVVYGALRLVPVVSNYKILLHLFS